MKSSGLSSYPTCAIITPNDKEKEMAKIPLPKKDIHYFHPPGSDRPDNFAIGRIWQIFQIHLLDTFFPERFSRHICNQQT